MIKKCSVCHIEKDLSEFHKHPKCRLGRANKCKKCVKKYRQKLALRKKKERDLYPTDLTKKCTACHQQLVLDEFSKAPVGKYGRQPKCKKCFSNYYNENKKDILKRVKEYNLKNKEKIAEYQKNYKTNNQDKLRNYKKEYYRKNRSKIIKKVIDWSKEHPNQYYQNQRAAAHRRRARIHKNGNNTLTAQEIKDLFKQHPYCEYCGIEEALTLDHIIPISKGGQNCLENVTIACNKCNSSKNASLNWISD